MTWIQSARYASNVLPVDQIKNWIFVAIRTSATMLVICVTAPLVIAEDAAISAAVATPVERSRCIIAAISIERMIEVVSDVMQVGGQSISRNDLVTSLKSLVDDQSGWDRPYRRAGPSDSRLTPILQAIPL